MGQVTATTTINIAAEPAVVLAALADYADVRPAILTPNYRDYTVISGGTGNGTVASWTLKATEKRSRNVVATISATENTVTEKDANSTLVTTFTTAAAASGTSVTVNSSWTGATGIGGFFERTFAPKGLNRIHDELLANLKRRLES